MVYLNITNECHLASWYEEVAAWLRVEGYQ